VGSSFKEVEMTSGELNVERGTYANEKDTVGPLNWERVGLTEKTVEGWGSGQ